MKTTVTRGEAGWDGECQCGFTSVGHDTQKSGKERMAEHKAEHETGEVQ